MTDRRDAPRGGRDPGTPDDTVVVPAPAPAQAEAPDETVVVPGPAPALPETPDETVVVPTPAPAQAEASDETVVVPAPVPSPVSSDETVVVPAQAPAPAPAEAPDETVVRRAANPAPPVADPGRAELPPEIAARMFKSPLNAKYRVPAAPTEAPQHALPRRGVTPALPVLTSTRAGRANAATSETDARIGPPPRPDSAPPAVDRTGLRSIERANRRFGIATVIGFAASVVVAAAGLTAIAVIVLR